MKKGAAIASAAGLATVALALVLSGGSPVPSQSSAPVAGHERASAGSSAATPSRGTRENCSRRSEAQFPGAFNNTRNVVVGPLVLVGGATYSSARAVRALGGGKFPLLVKAGHNVTVQVASRGRVAGLAYEHRPRGARTLDDAYASVTFVACRRGVRSGSSANGVAVTFWSGFVLTRVPSCVALNIYVDEERSPRRVGLSLGRRCPR